METWHLVRWQWYFALWLIGWHSYIFSMSVVETCVGESLLRPQVFHVFLYSLQARTWWYLKLVCDCLHAHLFPSHFSPLSHHSPLCNQVLQVSLNKPRIRFMFYHFLLCTEFHDAIWNVMWVKAALRHLLSSWSNIHKIPNQDTSAVLPDMPEFEGQPKIYMQYSCVLLKISLGWLIGHVIIVYIFQALFCVC